MGWELIGLQQAMGKTAVLEYSAEWWRLIIVAEINRAVILQHGIPVMQ